MLKINRLQSIIQIHTIHNIFFTTRPLTACTISMSEQKYLTVLACKSKKKKFNIGRELYYLTSQNLQPYTSLMAKCE